MPDLERELSTQLERRGESARFVVATLDPLYQDRLEHLGYLSIGNDRFATRWFRYSSSVPRYYERFAGSIERMVVLQSACLVQIPWKDARRSIANAHRGFSKTSIRCSSSGSVAALDGSGL
jgi:hypothetical protein